MEIVKQSVKLLYPTTPEEGVEQLKRVEYAGRNCYRSQHKITDDSYKRFIGSLVARGHGSPLEFSQFAVEVVTGRDVLAELTRHRLASFAVESQRYVNESGSSGIKFILPECYQMDDEASRIWETSMKLAEQEYERLIRLGWKNQDARKVLPNSTACVVCMSANIREWLHVFDLRTSPAAYPEMRALMNMIVDKFNYVFPNLYERKYDDDEK